MRTTPITLLLPIALTLGGCADKKMVVEHATSGAPVSTFERYHLVVTPTDRATSKHWMIEKAIHDDLRAKGYTPVDRGSADVVVHYDVDVDEDVAERNTATNAAPPPEGEAFKTIAVRIDRTDRDRTIWKGTSMGKVPPTHLTASLEHAIEEILEGVPASAQARATR